MLDMKQKNVEIHVGQLYYDIVYSSYAMGCTDI